MMVMAAILANFLIRTAITTTTTINVIFIKNCCSALSIVLADHKVYSDDINYQYQEYDFISRTIHLIENFDNLSNDKRRWVRMLIAYKSLIEIAGSDIVQLSRDLIGDFFSFYLVQQWWQAVTMNVL